MPHDTSFRSSQSAVCACLDRVPPRRRCRVAVPDRPKLDTAADVIAAGIRFIEAAGAA
jgi:hypothetical protein